MTLLKRNELARIFSIEASFRKVSEILEGPCLEEPQVSYNVINMLWIISYHKFTYKYFEDYTLALIEKCAKIIDYFNWEKITRIILLLFNNLKEIPICQEHLSDIDALNIIMKL